jgi:hypothetical protein
MPFSTSAADYQLGQWATNEALYISLHTAYSATGANELTGGSYARVAVTWGTPGSNAVALAGTPYTLNVPASTTVAFVGFQSASSGGTFQGMSPLGGATGFGFSAPSSSSTLLAPGTAYSNGQTVVVFQPAGTTIPAGLSIGTIYFVVSASGDTFKLSATLGGSAITLTADGSGLVQAITTEAFSGAGTYQVTAATWSLG